MAIRKSEFNKVQKELADTKVELELANAKIKDLRTRVPEVVYKERRVEVPVEKVITKETLKEVPVEKIVYKEVIKEVPVEKVRHVRTADLSVLTKKELLKALEALDGKTVK